MIQIENVKQMLQEKSLYELQMIGSIADVWDEIETEANASIEEGEIESVNTRGLITSIVEGHVIVEKHVIFKYGVDRYAQMLELARFSSFIRHLCQKHRHLLHDVNVDIFDNMTTSDDDEDELPF